VRTSRSTRTPAALNPTAKSLSLTTFPAEPLTGTLTAPLALTPTGRRCRKVTLLAAWRFSARKCRKTSLRSKAASIPSSLNPSRLKTACNRSPHRYVSRLRVSQSTQHKPDSSGYRDRRQQLPPRLPETLSKQDVGVVPKRRYLSLAAYCLDVDGDLYFVTYHHAAGFEGCVPGESEFLAA